jgi:hypothetical protein
LVQGEELAATNRPNKGKVALALVEWLIVVMSVGGKVDGTKTSATEGKTKDKADIPVVGGEVYSTSSTGGNINVEAGATPAVGRMVEVAVVGGEVDSTSSTVGNINVKAGATPAVGQGRSHTSSRKDGRSSSGRRRGRFDIINSRKHQCQGRSHTSSRIGQCVALGSGWRARCRLETAPRPHKASIPSREGVKFLGSLGVERE